MKHLSERVEEIHQLLLKTFPPEQLALSELERRLYSRDASIYRILPVAVVRPRNLADMQALFKLADEHHIPLTLRAAGTSLSGQAVGPGIVVDISRHWRAFSISSNAETVTVGPGVVGAHANERLASHQKKIGPDPASIQAARLGGILANNSSGMCCGVAQNAYHTLESMKFLLPNGSFVDSSLPDASAQFRREHPDLAQSLLALREKLKKDENLSEKVRKKYRYKNTTGYGINSFFDFDDPLKILEHLLIGSEGTLAFIAEATLKTVPLPIATETGLLVFSTVAEAAAAIPLLVSQNAAAVELMDRTSLASLEGQKGTPAWIPSLPANATALLIEFQAENESTIESLKTRIETVMNALHPIALQPFTSDAAEIAALWKLRKGIFPAVGARRQSGTSVIIEDVLFPVETLANGVAALQNLFERFSYQDAIIFGHAKDGNLHFVLCQDFSLDSERERYRLFMQEMVDLVVTKYGGALKAEHGTGRNIASFVETEWGTEGYSIMKELKSLIDPKNILNPDVIISSDPQIHLRDLKSIPLVHCEVDRCIECGYCEPICPSAELTLSPRQRISALREGMNFRNTPNLAYLLADTCATDGLCATSCPVEINTGTLVKQLRSESASPLSHRFAKLLQQRFALVELLLRATLATAHRLATLVGHRQLEKLANLPHRLASLNSPRWHKHIPLAAQGLPVTKTIPSPQHRAILFPSCVHRMMGNDPAKPEAPTLAETLLRLANRAQCQLTLPEKPHGICCGMPFFSKGFFEAGEASLAKFVENMWKWTAEGEIPIVIDNSPCSQSLQQYQNRLSIRHQEMLQKMRVLDLVDYLHDILLPRFTVEPLSTPLFVYPVCSVTKMGNTTKLISLARALSHSSVVPIRPACCAQAGDRGFFMPELAHAACEKIEWRVPGSLTDSERAKARHVSTSRTCEANLSHEMGVVFESVAAVLLDCSRDSK